MPFLQGVVYLLGLGVASHFVGEALPRNRFFWDRFPYRAWKWEREGKIYDKIKIRVWKDRVPDKSRVIKSMVPKRLGCCPSSESVYRLIRETCVAEAVHVGLCLLAVPVCVLGEGSGCFLLTVAFVLGNLPFIMIQRYNRPALISLAARLRKREERRGNAGTHSVGEHGRRT